MIIQNWADLLYFSFQQVWGQFIGFVPSLVGALIVLIVGLIFASVLASLLEKVVGTLKVDKALSRAGIGEYVERAGLDLNTGKFLGQVLYWLVVIIVIMTISNFLGLNDLSFFLFNALSYVGHVIVGVAIMLATVILANFLRRVVKASVMSAKLHAAGFLSTLAWWSVIVFGLVIALDQIGVNTIIIQTVITGIIAMFAIAGGIAFGLGGKDYASNLIQKFRDNVEHR
ncbi:MAG: hypothetical protein A3D47_01570 [Candidatus Colwellbacteria bacterium RIFCSPHIGHO2_02_FULL_43_15]|uniref:CmpX protein n=2 Tax=Candidatus Colwelliibacteriota TaxID=1817904 RepID=A0A1G1YYQ6_9BACT|nr:MAG: hypothetical protein A3D47_01570 [Candidatus Colwellbacteria bacterium RIFCSPHIGHO2_02_FULL_43_15]OGY60992.1 MAG: hypothetical protein A3F99_01485 [Candidatus Colwellbacteria bacterium RIFCSPLOWO2_12_FULL_43_11]